MNVVRKAFCISVIFAFYFGIKSATAIPLKPVAPIPDSAFREILPSPSLIALPPLREDHNVTVHIIRPDNIPKRPKVRVPVSPVIVVNIAVQPKQSRHLISGWASYYCRSGVSKCVRNHPDTSGPDYYAAAGPKLRVAMGGGVSVHAPQPWRGKIIYVDGVRVQLIDWCQCYYRQSNEKIIDLYYDVFKITGSKVTIRW